MARACMLAVAFATLSAWSAILLGLSPVSSQQIGNTLLVHSGFELHAALTSPQITRILVARNINFSLDTCPFPAAEGFSATLIRRNITISSLTAAEAAAAAAAAKFSGSQLQSISAPAASDSTGPPYQLNCNYLTDRFQLEQGQQVILSNLILHNCPTHSVFGFFRKTPGSSVVLDRVIDDRGSVCVPLELYYQSLVGPGAANSSVNSAAGQQIVQPYQSRQQSAQLIPAGANWCSRTANSSSNGAGGAQLPLAGSNTSLCQQQAVLLSNVSYQDYPGNSNGTYSQPYSLTAINSVALCPQPISASCIQSQGIAACLAAAYEAVNPDNLAPCPVTDGTSLQGCLANPAFKRIVLIQSALMKLSTSPAQSSPKIIDRDVTIMADPRGPRNKLDCGLLSNRFELAPGRILTLYHLTITNCTSTKPLSFIRITTGSRLVINDSFVVQPPGLCAPVGDTANNTAGTAQAQPNAISSANPRPKTIPGTQQFVLAQPGDWCNRNNGLTGAIAGGAQDDGSYSNIENLGLFAATTGFGPADAATIAAPSLTPWYVNPTWQDDQYCTNLTGPPPTLIVDYAVTEHNAWQASSNPANGSSEKNATQTSQQQQETPKFGSDLDDVNGSYSGAYDLWYIRSPMLCPSPTPPPGVGDGCSVAAQGDACAAQIYGAVDPDRQMVPGAAAYQEALAAGIDPNGGGNHGVKVVLPAVLGAVGGAAILGGILAAFILRHRKHTRAVQESHKALPTHGVQHQQHHKIAPAGPLSWLGLGSNSYSPASSDPARALLGLQSTHTSGSGDRSLLGTGLRGRLQQSIGPDGIQLGTLLGAGSFGRVYAGAWHDKAVAVKVITHSSADDDRIKQELTLSISFDHPNLVRALHYARVDIGPHRPSDIGPQGDSDLFLPQGAVGVFNLPPEWAVVQRTQAAANQAPAIDTETWIVMDLMDRGNLAAELRHGNTFINKQTGALDMASLLRRAADAASALAYLHSRNVCHGDLKWENVLLKTEQRDADGVMAKVADFGLSRALAFGQSHLSTRRYGTVTHMPPELLVAGKLTPAADVYSFGIMMWELVTQALPFKGLHHGEVIHKVVTEDLRPNPWPAAEAGLVLPADYVPLAEACWARRADMRPTMAKVLQRLLDMLAEAEGAHGVGV